MCNCATKQFKKTLHYESPAHGGWGVVKTGHLVPESYQLFVSPAACGRHGALAAKIEDRKQRVSYLFLKEEEIVSGSYEDSILEATEILLNNLEKRNRKPKVLMIFVSCIDDLLGTDNDSLAEILEEKHPDVKFRFCHMNPISCDSSIPPGMNIQNQDYSLLEKSDIHDDGVNLIGVLNPIKETSEIHELLKVMGASDTRHISTYKSFLHYQEMAKSKLNILLAPTGKVAAQNMEKKLGIPFYTAITSFRPELIEEHYKEIAKILGVKCPDLSNYKKTAKEALNKAKEALNNLPIIIDGEAVTLPFDLGRSLLENGFNVETIYEQQLLPYDKENYEWIVKNHPEVNIIQPLSPKTNVSPKCGEGRLAIGYSAAYISGADYVMNLSGQHGLYGFKGLEELCGLMIAASKKKADLKKFIDDAVIVV